MELSPRVFRGFPLDEQKSFITTLDRFTISWSAPSTTSSINLDHVDPQLTNISRKVIQTSAAVGPERISFNIHPTELSSTTFFEVHGEPKNSQVLCWRRTSTHVLTAHPRDRSEVRMRPIAHGSPFSCQSRSHTACF